MARAELSADTGRMSDDRSDTCAICGGDLYRFGSNEYQHVGDALAQNDDHNAVPTNDPDWIDRGDQSDGSPS